MKSLIHLFLLLFICLSCSKEESNEYEPYVKGSIVGYAMLTDQYGNLLDDHSGITVYTEPGRKFSGKTDIDGRFTIKGVPTGTYNLSFEKEGFGSMRYLEVHHLGGKPTILGMPTSGYWNRIVLHEDISVQVTNISIFEESQLLIGVAYSGAQLLEGLYIRLFFSASDGFLVENAEYALNIKLDDRATYLALPDIPFESGTTVYCKGRLFTSGANIMLAPGLYAIPIDRYYDEILDVTVYPNITDESDQYALIMP